MVVHKRPKYNFLLGDNALSLFDYFGVDQMHGLTREGCKKRMAEGGTYIDGLSNYNPKNPKLKPFVFINKSSLHGDYRDITLLMHEMMHISLLLHEWDVENKEEDIITWAEEEALYFADLMMKGEFFS